MGEVHKGGEGLHYTLVPSKKKKKKKMMMMIMMNIFHNLSYENLGERGEG
jgi:hypothetical protein